MVPKRFRSTAPLGPYTHPQRPPTLKKRKCAFVYTFMLYLKNGLNKIIRVKLNFYVLINKLELIIFFTINNNSSSNSLFKK